MDRDIIIIGAGRGGRFATDICDAAGRNVTGFLDDINPPGTLISGRPVLGGTDRLEDIRALGDHDFLISIGDIGWRRRFCCRIKRQGGNLASVMHPNVYVSPYATLGDGYLIHPFTSIYAGAVLGELVMIEDHGSVGIDVVIEDNVVLAPGVTLTAQSGVGRDTFVGAGVTVTPESRIGHDCLIGAGATVTSSVPAGKVAFGVPARAVRDNTNAG